jgi:hypothetical protein
MQFVVMNDDDDVGKLGSDHCPGGHATHVLFSESRWKLRDVGGRISDDRYDVAGRYVPEGQ